MPLHIEVLCSWANDGNGQWLPATLDTSLRALVWQDGPVADSVPVRIRHGPLIGDLASAWRLEGTLKGWGYRSVTLVEEDTP